MDDCIIGRAYYVVGSYITKTIDEELGREVLKKKLLEGPVSLIITYNQTAKEDLKILF